MKRKISAGHAVKYSRISCFLRELSKNRTLFLMTLPAVVLIIILCYLPMFGIVLAFKNFTFIKGFFGSEWVGLKNFEYLFTSSYAFIITRNTVLYNLCFIILGTILSLFIAIALNELHNNKLSKLYHSCTFIPFFLSWVVVSYLLFSFLSIDKGFINVSILKFFGIEAINWYVEPKYWPFIITFCSCWKNLGYSSIIYMAGLMGIDQEYYESAVVDGATKWQQITKITIPHMSTMMCIMVLLATGNIFRSDFGLFYQVPLNTGALYDVTNVLDTYVFRSLTRIGDIGMASAAGFYQAVVGFVLVLAANLAVKKIDDSKSLF